MPAGLQVWNSAGTLVLDTTSRLATYVGQVNTGTSNGSIVTDTTKGTPWAYSIPVNPPTIFHVLPDVWFSGNTLNWSFASVQWSDPAPVIINYGFF